MATPFPTHILRSVRVEDVRQKDFAQTLRDQLSEPVVELGAEDGHTVRVALVSRDYNKFKSVCSKMGYEASSW